MTGCHYNPETRDYHHDDGTPCRHDPAGKPTRHCTARRTCSQHLQPDELTCGRCLHRTRHDLRWIPDLAALLPVAALNDGTHSEAANLAGPAADYRIYTARRAIARRWILTHIPERHLARAIDALLPDDDPWHPYAVLTRWHLMLAEDYHHPLPTRLSVEDSADYLDRTLTRTAHDPAQDFPLMRAELRTCRLHLEAVLHNGHQPERGAPCPTCATAGVHLERHYGHWCEDPDCERVHYDTDEGDRWVCTTHPGHWWSEREYRAYVEERVRVGV
jgi:hypothetical protein